MNNSNNKIGFLIPIRLSSERLPGKALKELNGKTVFENLLCRIKLSKYFNPDNVVVCTTQESTDDKLEQFLDDKGIQCFRGSTDDIIDRFYNCCKHYGFDAVIQIDGDDPCTDPEYMDKCMDKLLENENLGIVYIEGLPLGTASKAFKVSALNKIWNAKLDDLNDTGFMYYFLKTNLVEKYVIKDIPENHRNERARLTLDYEEDLKFFSELLKLAENDGNVATLTKLVEVMNQNPELLEINTFLNDRYWQRTAEKISLHYKDDGGNLREIRY